MALSMALTPLIYAGASHLARRLEGIEAPSQFAPSRNTDQQVVIAGIARFGQCVGRILRGLNISFTAPEINPEHIAITRRFGTKAHYGDTSNLDLLRMAYLENARVIVIAIDDSDALICTAALVLQHFPQVETLARARDRQHAYRLLDLGVTRVERELLHSALHLTDQLLRTLGMSVQGTHRTIGAFRRNNLVAPNQAHAVYKD